MSFVAVAIGVSTVVGAGASIYGASQSSKAAGAASDAQVQANKDNIEFAKWLYTDTKAQYEPWYNAGTQALTQMQKGIADGSFDIGTFMASDVYDPGMFKFDASKVQIDPGYSFRLNEGINALDRSASSRGMVQSGAQQKAISQYGQDLSSQEYGAAYDREYQNQLTEYNSGVDRYSREYNAKRDTYNSSVADKQNSYNILNNLSSGGQSAVSGMQGAANNLSTQVGASTINTGNAIANGALNSAAAWNTGITGAATAVNQGAQNYLLENYLKKK